MCSSSHVIGQRWWCDIKMKHSAEKVVNAYTCNIIRDEGLIVTRLFPSPPPCSWSAVSVSAPLVPSLQWLHREGGEGTHTMNSY